MSKLLAELLLRDNIISQAQFTDAIQGSPAGKDPVRFLIEQKHVSETKLLYFLSQKFRLPSINLAKFEIKADVLSLIPFDIAKKLAVLPIQQNKGTLVVALTDPTDSGRLEFLKVRTQMHIEPVLTSYSALDAAFEKYYSASTAAAGSAIESFRKEAKSQSREESLVIQNVQVHEIDSGAGGGDAPVIALVNGILTDAIRKRASDIHVECYEKRCRVRLRIDGTLHQLLEIPLEMKRAVTARFKVMSRMDIGESRIPQDGRIKLKAGGKEIDFRVNTLPMLFGEKIVLRMLNKSNLNLDLERLGFEAQQLSTFKKGISSPNGMVLVTGPTGSGKTTTLYSALAELNTITDNISTAEDPVEYNLDGINQAQINKDVGLTFPIVLRALMRQDPDIILVGEIRDLETAEVAIQAALTGHLVLSTLHTNDAPSTITRLINMGIPSFLVVASLNTVIAQRLLRTICGKCKEEMHVPKERLLEVGFSPEEANSIKCYHGKGCPECGRSGYKGRVAIYEVLEFTESLKELVLKGENAIAFKKQAMKEGMKTLRDSALIRVAQGIVSLEEALSITTEH